MEHKIGQMIVIGVHGTRVEDPEIRQALTLAEKGKIGGVIFFKYNLENPTQIKALLEAFQKVKAPYPLFLALDQEGGKVQRLKAANGFKDFPSAQRVAETLMPAEALKMYAEMAQISKEMGFNLIFGPDVDLNPPAPQKPSPVIGALERSYGDSVETVVTYAKAFIKAHHHQGLLTSLKHFPGHGYAQADSHQGLVDITRTANSLELQPFYQLIEEGQADMVMMAHLMNRRWDKKYPATLSPKIIQRLLREKGDYEGVVITDDLHMGAIGQYYDFEEVVLGAVKAGNDILLFSNNQAAAQGVKDFKGSSSIVDQIHRILTQAVQEGDLPESRLSQSYERIVRLKKRLKRD